MKVIEIILSIIGILFGLLRLLNVLPFHITQPVMMLALATLFVLRGIEYKKKSDIGGFVLMLAVALFSYAVIVYNLFIG